MLKIPICAQARTMDNFLMVVEGQLIDPSQHQRFSPQQVAIRHISLTTYTLFQSITRTSRKAVSHSRVFCQAQDG